MALVLVLQTVDLDVWHSVSRVSLATKQPPSHGTDSSQRMLDDTAVISLRQATAHVLSPEALPTASCSALSCHSCAIERLLHCSLLSYLLSIGENAD